MERKHFRESVFKRDGGKCVFCTEFAQDAHHILERRLWNDGGYHINNGASVCEFHHIECEKTNISVEQVRTACGITKPIIPEHMYSDVIYDKWGNVILESGKRLKGELFYDESVQKILHDKLSLFVDYVKYPRTYHLPWSDNITDDDRVLSSTNIFEGQEVVVTEKMDGENTSMYCDHIHARSLDSQNHASRNWIKNFHSRIAHDIPKGWRICGENLYAVHSIEYTELPSLFMGFSVWNEQNICFSWDETLEWFTLLGIVPVPTIYRGPYNEKIMKHLKQTEKDSKEGYVVRLTAPFSFASFRKSLAKYVRPNHVSTIKHWFYGQEIKRNNMTLL